MAYRRSTGSKLRLAQPGLKIFREEGTAYRSRNRNDDKIRIRCEPLVRITPAAMGRKREASGYSEFMPRKIRISG